MTINKMTIKMLGQKCTVYRVIDQCGEVVRVFESLEEAQAFLAQ